jgi:hypothetical protein
MQGEAGTGKRLLAQAIHNSSHRADKPWSASSVRNEDEEEMKGHTAASDRLTAFNAKWQRREDAFFRNAPLPFWAPGLVLTTEVRETYENFLPVSEYAHDLASVLSEVLPHSERGDDTPFSAWVPSELRSSQLVSVADFLALLPDPIATNGLTWTLDELWPLACALASPLRFGTGARRYPRQRDQVAELAGFRNFVFAVDCGCGTGQGTWELAQWLPVGSLLVGVTLEPLEAWMSTHRRLPHLEWSFRNTDEKYAYPATNPAVTVAFAAGAVIDMRWTAPADLIVCNGLIGGPAMCEPAELASLWERFFSETAAGSVVLAGNQFHQGRLAAWERFLELMPVSFEAVDTRPDAAAFVRRA